MNRLLIHVGYPKTASTTLQTHVFPEIDTFAYDAAPRSFAREAMLHVAGTDDARYHRQTCAALIRELVESAGDKVPVLSLEILCGAPFGSSVIAGARTAERLAALPVAPTVLIVTRRQEDHLRSLYFQYVRSGGTMSFEEAITQPPDAVGIDPDYVCFDRLVGRYHELLGPDAVIVEPFESLVADFDASVNRLLGRLDLPPVTVAPPPHANASHSAAVAGVMRRWNRVFSSTNYGPEPVVGHVMAPQRVARLLGKVIPGSANTGDVTHRIPTEILGRFAESNRRLDEMTGGVLKGLGYRGAD